MTSIEMFLLAFKDNWLMCYRSSKKIIVVYYLRTLLIVYDNSHYTAMFNAEIVKFTDHCCYDNTNLQRHVRSAKFRAKCLSSVMLELHRTYTNTIDNTIMENNVPFSVSL